MYSLHALKSVLGKTLILFVLLGTSFAFATTATAAPISAGSFQISITLNDATSSPPIVVNLASSGAGINHSFANSTRANSVSIDPSTAVDAAANSILADLTGLSWQTGDLVVYSNGGGTSIGGLINGAVYYVANPTVVPEPGTAILLGLGLLSLGSRRRRSARSVLR